MEQAPQKAQSPGLHTTKRGGFLETVFQIPGHKKPPAVRGVFPSRRAPTFKLSIISLQDDEFDTAVLAHPFLGRVVGDRVVETVSLPGQPAPIDPL